MSIGPQAPVDRRVVLAAGGWLLIAGTGSVRTDRAAASLAALERRHGGRLGVCASDTHTGRTLRYRADEPFKLMSTFKALLSTLVLTDVAKGRDDLDAVVRIGPGDLMAASPVTQANLARGSMRVRELCEAIMHRSDNAAANLLMRRTGGPARLTAFLRSVGDRVTRIDHYEGGLTDQPLPADSSTPRAMTETMRRIMLGPVLPLAERRLWEGWMAGNVVGRARLRACFPSDWIAGDRTGTGDGICNDCAFARRPGVAPLLVSAFYTAPSLQMPDQEAVLREVSRIVVIWQSQRA